jgi:hypothetical protein
MIDWVDWLLTGGLLVHESCGQKTVSVKESFRNPWGYPDFYCSSCKHLVPRLEVPGWKFGDKLVQVVDKEQQRLEEMM